MTPSVVRGEKRRRWAVAAAAAAVLVSLPAVLAALPPATRTAEPGRLRALVLASAGKPYQGYAESTGALALPDLPNLGDVAKLFAGTTNIRAWYAGPDRYRVDQLGPAGEHDVYRLPDGEYTWDYGADTLTELIGDPAVRLPRASDLLPPALARRILEAAPADPVSALPARRVAGVDAPGLRLVPADPETTIGRVDVWADADSGLPVRVEVTARGSDAPILTSEFRDLEQTVPDVVAPQPGPGSGFSVTNAPDVANALGALAQVPLPRTLAGRTVSSSDFGGLEGTARYGGGLASFAVVAVPRHIANAAADAAGKAGAVEVRLAHGTLVQLSITPVSLAIVRPALSRRSYLLAGPVTTAVLRTAADELTQARR